MDQYDFDLMSAHFPALTDVMLLIRTTDWQAGFFVWEEGDMSRQRSYREFTFDPEALPLVDSAPEVAAPKDRTQPIPVVSPRSSNRRLPAMMKVGNNCRHGRPRRRTCLLHPRASLDTAGSTLRLQSP